MGNLLENWKKKRAIQEGNWDVHHEAHARKGVGGKGRGIPKKTACGNSVKNVEGGGLAETSEERGGEGTHKGKCT